MTSRPILLERSNVNDETVVLGRWHAQHGDRVEEGMLVAEVETSKVNMEVYAPATGYLQYHFQQGQDVPVDKPIGSIASVLPQEVAAFTVPASRKEEINPPETHALKPFLAHEDHFVANGAVRDNGNSYHAPALQMVAETEFRQRISPVAAKMMEVNGLTTRQFAGLSIVRKQDVLAVLNPPPPPQAQAPAAVSRPASPLPTQPYQEIALSRNKRREGETLLAGGNNAVQSTVSVTCFTRGLKRTLERQNGAGTSALILYEVSRLLRKYPVFNSTYRDGKRLQYEQVNVGYAMDDGRGLNVGVVHGCDTLSLVEITTELRTLTEAYIEDKLNTSQVMHATFTISDLSGMGVSSFFPLISQHQGAILGISGEQFQPDSTYGTYTLVLTFDHQLADGRTAAVFLAELKERLSHYEGRFQEPAPAVPTCVKCFRSLPELQSMGQHLLSLVPQGNLCTLCIAGY